ncbi:hypothetical protein ACLMJK_000133 [Lecanora helva]
MAKSERKTVLVTGANGYIGNAVARAFVRAGWITYGLVRKAEARTVLNSEEIISILGSASDKSFVERLATQTRIGPFDVVVSCTEQILDYVPHFNDTIALLRNVAKASNDQGVRPLVMFTSGCKDYGMTGLHGSEGLELHTEDSSLNAPPFAIDRATHAVKIFDHADLFDAVVLRPTTVYGLTSSFYGPIFDIAKETAAEGILEISANPNSIMHGTHIDDCAEAYVAIAQTDREITKGQCYNISSHRYETLDQVAQAVVKEYSIENGVKYLPEPKTTGLDVVQMLFGFSQGVDSQKVRRDTGWKDRRQLFSEGLRTYKKAYEAAAELSNPSVERIQGYVKLAKDGNKQ